ncbi:MAG: serine/threonine-protein kinase [Bryobacteraceae bacterium]|jgi:serine/threonine-protein kinase
MIGTRVAGYQILEKLGEGGMGVVYRAVDLSLDRVVALKALTAELAKNPELEQRFRAEARAQASLNHVNLATLYAFLVENGAAWMVMEFIEGETFASMIRRRGPIPSQEAVPLFRQALLGLGYAHRMGIVHRDIKPGNIMLNREGIVKVMDFGIAKVLGNRSMTRTGTQMGTAWYMAPEQVLNRGVDIRSDIYALGVTLYEMLSGRVPFESDSDYQVMADHVNTPPPPPTQFYPYIPQGVVNAVLKALAKDPNARFQTTEEFGAALENPDGFAWTPAAVAVAPVAAVPGVVAAGSMTQAPMRSDMAATVLLAPAAAQPPAPAPRPRFAWTLPRLALLGLGLAMLAGAAVYFTLHPPFHPKPDRGTSLAPITGSAGSTDTGSGTQVEIPPVQVPPAAAPGDSGKTSTGAGVRQPATSNPSGQLEQPQQQEEAPLARPALLIPAGTTVNVRTAELIDSSSTHIGQKFSASVDTPVLAAGNVVVPRGASAQLEVVNVTASGHFKGRAELELRLVALSVQGRFRAVHSDSIIREGSLRARTSAAVVGGAAAVGGAIGGMFHKKKGAAEGAAAGAGAGAGAEATTRGDVTIPSETRIEFHLRTALPVP